MLKTKGAALKQGTWPNYQRCVRHLVTFESEFQMQVFPVITPGRASALSLFFEWLAEQGLSWGRMSNYRAVIRCRASGVPDPWDRYQVLRDMAEGMKKRRT
eukprot:2638923-Rhodomonas_salina.1